MAVIRLVCLLIAFCALAACGLLRPNTTRPLPIVRLDVIGSSILPDAPVGSSADVIAELSGAWFDAAAGELFVVSDRRDRPGLFTMRVDVSPAVRLTPVRFTSAERALASRTLDLEGVAPAAEGHLFLSSEGEDGNPDRPASGIYEYTRGGQYRRRLLVPAAYAGMRSNAGFEGLTVSPDGRRLFAATEGSLRQDGPAASFDAGSINRILAYDLASDDTREYAYRTEPVPRLPDQSTATGDNGISEILALGDDDLLVLERAYVEERGTANRSANAVRLYQVHLDREGDITGQWSLADTPPSTVLKKTLVLDLATIAGQLGDRLRNLENFEALSFGPTLPDGRRTLLLISDNNCSDTQVTALVVLALSNPKSQVPNPKVQAAKPRA